MRKRYEDFLRRLNQYRLYLNMTQDELSNALGITQSQFSKIELGKTVMPYRTLELLEGMGWDIYYLVTGKNFDRNASKLNEMLKQVEEEDKREVLNVVTWLLKQGMNKCCPNMSPEYKCEMEILQMRVSGEGPRSVLYEVRKISDVAQAIMAEKLGVNIKKYRKLEKKEVYPDVELLFHIYEVTRCKPSLILHNDCVESIIIDDLWNQITEPVQNKILTLTEQILWFLKM